MLHKLEVPQLQVQLKGYQCLYISPSYSTTCAGWLRSCQLVMVLAIPLSECQTWHKPGPLIRTRSLSDCVVTSGIHNHIWNISTFNVQGATWINWKSFLHPDSKWLEPPCMPTLCMFHLLSALLWLLQLSSRHQHFPSCSWVILNLISICGSEVLLHSTLECIKCIQWYTPGIPELFLL